MLKHVLRRQLRLVLLLLQPLCQLWFCLSFFKGTWHGLFIILLQL
jgi:hypothetical protein